MRINAVTELGGLGATYAVHLPLIGTLVGDFFTRCFRFVTIYAFDGQTDRQNVNSKVQSNEVRYAQKFKNIQKGAWPGSRDLLFKLWDPLISLERLKVET